MDGNPKRIKKDAFSKISGYVWTGPETLINRETCTMVYKSLNELAPENLGSIFHKLSDVHTRVLRDTKCNLAVPKMRTAYGQKSFAFRGAKAWNELDSEMKLAPSIQSFKTKLKALNCEYSRKAALHRKSHLYVSFSRFYSHVIRNYCK